ncbi:MAG: Na+/H+ antiporter subunit E [Promicromonosporaceae bacterium]|nr:Na+/H+ antiporter subunit E [Promicromonosporaceae bacterium]
MSPVPTQPDALPPTQPHALPPALPPETPPPPLPIWRRVLRAIPVVLAFTLVWVIMNELLSPLVIISGLLVASLALVVTRILSKKSFAGDLWLGWRAGLRYFPYLIWQIMISAVAMIKVIITGDSQVHEFEFESTLHDDLSLFFLATTIILTPGSVVVGREGSRFLVVSIGATEEQALASCRQLEAGIARLHIHGDAL